MSATQESLPLVKILPRPFRSCIRRVYYRWGYGSDTPLARLTGRFVQQIEQHHDTYDVPISPEEWDEKYAKGKWENLRSVSQVPHYCTIAGLHHRFSRNGAILDVGCGDGILHGLIRPYGYSRYLGLDTSAAAVATLEERCDEQTRFIVGDAETYTPAEKYDTIIFCESLVYFHQPIAALRRYAQALAPEGVILLSIFQMSARPRAILAQIRREFRLVMDIEIRVATSRRVVCAIAPG